MKNSIRVWIVVICLMVSCATQKKHNEYIQVYKTDGLGDMLPEYLILRTGNMNYELYYPGLNISTLGSYENSGDTLQLKPRYECIGSRVWDVDTLEDAHSAITMFLRIDKNKLSDVTDYEKYPELIPYLNPNIVVCRRVK